MAQVRRFQVATEMRMGSGAADGLLDAIRELGGRRVTVMTDTGVRGAGIVDRLLAPVLAAGIPVDIDDTARPNPRDIDCDASAARAVAHGTDLVVAIGGGSPIDAAKAVALVATNGGLTRAWGGKKPFECPPLPLIAVPTTAGTGSEVTRVSVITDTTRAFKTTLGGPGMAPRVALIDAQLTLSVPPAITAATGIDALTHAVEAFTGRKANPVSDVLALNAIRTISQHLETAVRDGSNLAAREGMMEASAIAGLAFGNADVAAVHCISEAIGGLYDTPHGVANSVFLPVVFAYNVPADPARHAAVAEALGVRRGGRSDEALAQAGAEALRELSRAVGIPTFRALPRVNPADFSRLAAASQENVSTLSNARELTEVDYTILLQTAYDA